MAKHSLTISNSVGTTKSSNSGTLAKNLHNKECSSTTPLGRTCSNRGAAGIRRPRSGVNNVDL